MEAFRRIRRVGRMGYYRQIHTKSFWDKFAENLAKLELFCVHGCGKCVFLTQKPGSHQRRVPRAGCGDASILVLSLWSENLAKLELFCVHGLGKCVFLTVQYSSADIVNTSIYIGVDDITTIYRGGRYIDSDILSISRGVRYIDSDGATGLKI